MEFKKHQSWVDRNVKPKTKIRGNRPLEFFIGDKEPDDLIKELQKFNDMIIEFSNIFSAFRVTRSQRQAEKLRLLLGIITNGHIPAKKYLSYFVHNAGGKVLTNRDNDIKKIQQLLHLGYKTKALALAKECGFSLTERDIKFIKTLKFDPSKIKKSLLLDGQKVKEYFL